VPIVPLKRISYEDGADARRLIDILNHNFRLLEWLLSGRLDKVNLGITDLSGDVFLEFDAKGLINPCDFAFKNYYATEPYVFLGVTSNDPSAFAQPFSIIASHLTALDSNNVKYYLGVRATIAGNYPTGGNHKITMLAICTDKIDKAPTS